MIESVSNAIQRQFVSSQRIALVSHVRPDQDAIGSMLGLGLALQRHQKQVDLILADGVPYNLHFLPGWESIVRQPTFQPDLTVVLDCSDLQRVGGVLGDCIPDINIDHHITNLNFAKTNLVLPEAVATAAILAEYLPEWGFEIDLQAASALLTGIIGDTLGFKTSNMNPKALRLAATLMEKGANLPDLYNQSLNRRSFEAARYWGCGLGKLKKQGKLIWTELTLEDRKAVAYPGNDDADLVNVLTSINSGTIAVIFIEQKDGKVKVSWRSQPGYDVSGIAVQFGGGGHPAASGAEISGDLITVREKVLEATQVLIQDGKKPLSVEQDHGEMMNGR